MANGGIGIAGSRADEEEKELSLSPPEPSQALISQDVTPEADPTAQQELVRKLQDNPHPKSSGFTSALTAISKALVNAGAGFGGREIPFTPAAEAAAKAAAQELALRKVTTLSTVFKTAEDMDPALRDAFFERVGAALGDDVIADLKQMTKNGTNGAMLAVLQSLPKEHQQFLMNSPWKLRKKVMEDPTQMLQMNKFLDPSAVPRIKQELVTAAKGLQQTREGRERISMMLQDGVVTTSEISELGTLQQGDIDLIERNPASFTFKMPDGTDFRVISDAQAAEEAETLRVEAAKREATPAKITFKERKKEDGSTELVPVREKPGEEPQVIGKPIPFSAAKLDKLTQNQEWDTALDMRAAGAKVDRDVVKNEDIATFVDQLTPAQAQTMRSKQGGIIIDPETGLISIGAGPDAFDKVKRRKFELQIEKLDTDAQRRASRIIRLNSLKEAVRDIPGSVGLTGTINELQRGLLGQVSVKLSNQFSELLTGASGIESGELRTRLKALVPKLIEEITGEESGRYTEAERALTELFVSALNPTRSALQVEEALFVLQREAVINNQEDYVETIGLRSKLFGNETGDVRVSSRFLDPRKLDFNEAGEPVRNEFLDNWLEVTAAMLGIDDYASNRESARRLQSVLREALNSNISGLAARTTVPAERVK